MSDKLETGYQIETEGKFTLTIQKFLGEGGQGDVYEVDYNGKPHALKWYKKSILENNDNKLYNLVKSNIEQGSPSESFLWPMDITNIEDDTFGYVMPLREDGFYEVSQFMLRQQHFPSFRTTIDACLNIVNAFRLLHVKGYSYQDLNDGNFFINPKNGKVLICDNDNVAPPGQETGILGKAGYMAPEIVTRKGNPDKYSDYFSLSVILFILLCSSHPLEGKLALQPCLTQELQNKLYGSEALFVMDPNNNDNAPDPTIHKNVLMIWGYLPDYLKDTFLKAFGQEALTTPQRRPPELEWIEVLARFRSEVVSCPTPNCGNEIFAANGIVPPCDCCNKTQAYYHLEFPQFKLPVVKGTRIYRWEVVTGCNADRALDPVALIVEKDGKFGILNKMETHWDAITPSGKSKKVMSQEVVPVKEGIVVEIEGTKIKIGQ